MIRVDIYCVNGKYYFVPVYASDVVRDRLPNKCAAKNKNSSDWEIVDDKYFLFSLYKMIYYI